jgi:rhamnogalacturonyl hydrolase YesR
MKIIQFALLASFLFWSAGTSAQSEKSLFEPQNIKTAMLRAANWQLDHPRHAAYDWTNGAFYAGVFAAYETTKDIGILQALIEMGEKNEWRPGIRLHHADDHVIVQSYIDLYRLLQDPKMIRPFHTTMTEFQQYPYHSDEELKPIAWWWCDALFMGPPTFVKYALTFKKPKILSLSDQLFQECYDLLYDKEEHFFARDIRYQWDATGKGRKESNGKKIFWSRGNGWVAGGLVRILSELPADYPKRAFYEKLYREMMETVVSIQPEDGLWRSSLLDPDAYPHGEASGTGFFCYALAWGINNGLLDKNKYLPAVEKAWVGLNSLQKKDGMIGWVQPIGADPQKNFSPDSWEVYGSGAFCLAGSEVIKLKR